MKIIKKGKNRPPQKMFTCSKCDCKFLAEEGDKNLDPRDGDFVICPTCGYTIGWELGQISKGIAKDQ